MNELTHLDLFSGIGGFALAAGWAGFRTVGFSEVEPYACRVLAERWPGVPNIGDVRIAANFARFRGCTVVSAGFPCQPVSEAGEQRGEGDVRWLWPATLAVVSIARPTWFIGENVSGLIGMGLLDKVCADLENIGYGTQPLTIPASGAGAWHVRERVWILAHADGARESQPEGPEQEVRGRHIDGDQAQVLSRPAGGRRKGRNLREGIGGEFTADISPDLMREGSHTRPHAGLYRGQEGAGSRNEHSDGLFQWPPEPPLVRMVHGIPNRAHRIKGLGNSIVPQVVAPFFQWIAQIERGALPIS
jgi:DNA (cytosine-5)-methyltransferase 1